MAQRPTSRPMPRWISKAPACTACGATLYDEQAFAVVGMDSKPRALCPDCAELVLARYRQAERSVLRELEALWRRPSLEPGIERGETPG